MGKLMLAMIPAAHGSVGIAVVTFSLSDAVYKHVKLVPYSEFARKVGSPVTMRKPWLLLVLRLDLTCRDTNGSKSSHIAIVRWLDVVYGHSAVCFF